MKAVNLNDVLKVLHEYGPYLFAGDEHKWRHMVDKIIDIPAVNTLKGKWIVDTTGLTGMSDGYYLCCRCSVCNDEHTFYDYKSGTGPDIKNVETYNYCPNCGAFMKGGEDGDI